MIGAHVGNWEIGVPFFDDYGKKINIVMYDAEHRRIKEILEKNGQDKDFKIIPVNEDNLTHVFRITEALNKKEYVCFQGDRYLNKEKLLTGTLLGQKAPFPAGPFLLGDLRHAVDPCDFVGPVRAADERIDIEYRAAVVLLERAHQLHFVVVDGRFDEFFIEVPLPQFCHGWVRSAPGQVFPYFVTLC